LFASAPVTCVPLTAFVPLQPSDAVHDVALVALQVNVTESPLPTIPDEEVKTTTGAGVSTAAEEVPPGVEFVDTSLPHAATLAIAAAQINLSNRT
jgi:hypothetical protein